MFISNLFSSCFPKNPHAVSASPQPSLWQQISSFTRRHLPHFHSHDKSDLSGVDLQPLKMNDSWCDYCNEEGEVQLEERDGSISSAVEQVKQASVAQQRASIESHLQDGIVAAEAYLKSTFSGFLTTIPAETDLQDAVNYFLKYRNEFNESKVVEFKEGIFIVSEDQNTAFLTLVQINAETDKDTEMRKRVFLAVDLLGSTQEKIVAISELNETKIKDERCDYEAMHLPRETFERIRGVAKEDSGILPLFNLIDVQRKEYVENSSVVEKTEGKIQFLVQKLCHGDLITFKEKRGDLSNSEIKSMALKIATALESLHSRGGIVHRDLKPDNILMFVDKDGNLSPAIADFDFAIPSGAKRGSLNTQDNNDKNVKLDLVSGTSAYGAPESLLRGQCGTNSDVWQLVCTLYFFCTGEQPSIVSELDQKVKMKKSIDGWDEGNFKRLTPWIETEEWDMNDLEKLLNQAFHINPLERIALDDLIAGLKDVEEDCFSFAHKEILNVENLFDSDSDSEESQETLEDITSAN